MAGFGTVRRMVGGAGSKAMRLRKHLPGKSWKYFRDPKEIPFNLHVRGRNTGRAPVGMGDRRD